MRYHCLHIESQFTEEWKKDLFDLHICELGVDTIDGNDYYIQSETWENNREDIEALCQWTEEVSRWTVEACPDENWNAAWEAEHPIQELPLGVKIIPHCAFGAGHHETTSMMINELINFKSQISNFQFSVLDHGTGTGVLAIFAKRLGAQRVVAVDIDDKSVENANENAALNGVEIEVQLGDSVPEGQYDLILANIHRNILLATMSAYAEHLREGGELWLSGFYETDCAVLQEAAESHGLRVTHVLANGEWRMMRCQKEARR